MGAREVAAEKFLDIVNGMRPNLDELYGGANSYELGDWKLKQQALVTASGGAAMAIPGLHLAGMIADIAFVLNRMSVSSFGTGAILGKAAGAGNILEAEDFAAVLGYWSHDDGVMQAMKGKSSAGASKVGAKVGAKLIGKVAFKKGVTKAMLTSSGYLIGQRLGGKAAAKSSAKFAGKFGGKALGGFVPFLGPVVSGGVNLWLISGILEAAENYYKDKIGLFTE